MRKTDRNRYGGWKRRRKVQIVRHEGTVVFILYMILLLYFLFFADWYNHVPGANMQAQANMTPFLEIRRFWTKRHVLGFKSVFLNLGGNILGFMPIGFFLPVITRHLRRFFRAVGIGFLISALVEIIQYYTGTGICDVDDVILNTFGAFLGYMAFLICDIVRKKIYGR